MGWGQVKSARDQKPLSDLWRPHEASVGLRRGIPQLYFTQHHRPESSTWDNRFSPPSNTQKSRKTRSACRHDIWAKVYIVGDARVLRDPTHHICITQTPLSTFRWMLGNKIKARAYYMYENTRTYQTTADGTHAWHQWHIDVCTWCICTCIRCGPSS